MKLRFGTNFAVFVGFFGISMLEAFQSRNWIKAAFWLAIGIIFLAGDNIKNGSRTPTNSSAGD